MLKKNWLEVQDRYRAFWRNEPVDRPPVIFDTIGSWCHPMYNGAGYDYTRYGTDITTFCHDFRAVWEARADVPDDTVPCIAPQMGGAIEAALLAGDIEWGEELSMLTPHNPLEKCEDLRGIRFRFDNPHFTRIRRELEYLSAASHGDFGINVEASMSLTTTISQLRGGMQFMFDVMDRPNEVRALAETALEALLALQAEVVRLNPLAEGTAHRWLNYWHPGTGFWFSEDDAVMLSAAMYHDLFLDLDMRLCAGVDIAVAHWHTVGLHLLPSLLEIPNLRMIQLSPPIPTDRTLRQCWQPVGPLSKQVARSASRLATRRTASGRSLRRCPRTRACSTLDMQTMQGTPVVLSARLRDWRMDAACMERRVTFMELDKILPVEVTDAQISTIFKTVEELRLEISTNDCKMGRNMNTILAAAPRPLDNKENTCLT